MTFQCRYTAEDYVNGYTAYAARSSRRWLTRLCWTLMALMLILAIFGSLGPHGNLASAMPLFLLTGFWFYLAIGMWKRAGRRASSGRPELAQDYSVGADDSGIVFDGSISQMHWTWAAFIKFAEANEIFLAYLSPCAFVILPKRVLGPGQVDELRELLRKKLPAK
jgi:hypothetical protein